MTDSSGRFAVRLTGGSGGSNTTFWFNPEVKGIIDSIRSTLNKGSL